MAASKLMSVAEWAERLGVSPSTAHEKVARGEIDLINVGTVRRPRIRISEEAHRKYLNSNRMEAPAAKPKRTRASAA